jgi:uncharacterized protein (DUF433 family)
MGHDGRTCWWSYPRRDTMSDEDLLKRIVIDPTVMVGQPSIQGTRLTVQYILRRLGHGESVDDILHEYPRLTREDIRACLLFAAAMLEDVTFVPLASAV